MCLVYGSTIPVIPVSPITVRANGSDEEEVVDLYDLSLAIASLNLNEGDILQEGLVALMVVVPMGYILTFGLLLHQDL